MTASVSPSLWLSPNPSKRWGELFFLLYTPFWLTLCLGIVIPFNLYEKFTELEYLLIGLVSAVPAFVIPMLCVGKADRSIAWKDRYWVKAVHFLHTGMIPGFFKNRLKTDNILLNENWMAKLSDYGLSTISEETDACGVKGESPNSWQMKMLEDDVYSFGFILLEALVGPSVSAKREAIVLNVMASIWIIIFSYVGNYFWTHYFFTVLGASYTFPSWKMNNVPHTTFLLTHVCFLFYHVSSNMTLRRLRHFIADLPEKIQWATEAAWILALAYFIAYLETLAISNFPYYQFVDRDSMYKVGSLFYAIYFIVSFPMFLRIDEKPGDKWDLPRVAVDALGAAMLVTIILDLWRIFLGPIVLIPDAKQCPQVGLPWFTGHANLT